MIESFFAGVTLAVCGLLALRLVVGERRRRRLDSAARRLAESGRRWFAGRLGRRSAHEASAKAAEEAIRRARGGKWDGNVYRPRTFRRPRKPH